MLRLQGRIGWQAAMRRSRRTSTSLTDSAGCAS